MSWEPSESDDPEDIWAHEHEDDLVGASTEAAAALVTEAGFRPFVFDAGSGHALAANKVSGTVVLVASAGFVRQVRR